MTKSSDLFKIQSNDVSPDKGRVLISEPFLRDTTFGRSVILLVDHGTEGTMGIIMNKRSTLIVNDVVKEFKYLNDIPLFKGGPIGMDTLFYLHTLPNIEGSLSIGNGIFLNGDFNEIKQYVLQGNPLEGNIRFFIGYSGWETEQLQQEIEENTWIIGQADTASLMTSPAKDLWKTSMEQQGKQYKTWARFPKVPSLN